MKFRLSFMGLLILVAPSFLAQADEAKHPAYLHALTDLRDARWLLSHHSGDSSVSYHEDKAVSEIDLAAAEIKKAAIEDDKNLGNHVKEDAPFDHAGQLHHALDLLEKAKKDLNEKEENSDAHGLKRNALEHVSRAIDATKHAIEDVENHK